MNLENHMGDFLAGQGKMTQGGEKLGVWDIAIKGF